MTVKSLVAAPPSGRRRPLLIDDADYSTAVIRQGAPIPWTDVAALTGHFGQVRGLLDPDAVWVDLRSVHAAHLQARPEVASAMGARGRTGYALKTLLGEPELLAATLETLTTLASTSRRPLVLDLPSPAHWLRWSHEVAGTALDAVDADRADSASMYAAEWLGHLGEVPVALVLLDARGQGVDDGTERLETYSALTNVVAHFDWSVAMRSDTEIQTGAGEPALGVLADSFWTDGADVPEADVLITSIPGSAGPEHVLDQLAKLS